MRASYKPGSVETVARAFSEIARARVAQNSRRALGSANRWNLYLELAV
jgi:hypothetical protein